MNAQGEAKADTLRAYADAAYERGTVPTRDGNTHDIVPAGTAQDAARVLHDLAYEAGATRTIETGLGLGLSALALGEAACRSGAPDALHTAIDPNEHWCGYAGVELLASCPAPEVFRVIERFSELVLPELVSGGERFDFAYVDGAHHFENALLDLIFCLRLLTPGSLCVVDDVWMPAVRLAAEYAITNMDAELLETPHDRFWVLRRPEHFPPRRQWDHFVPFGGLGERGAGDESD